VHRIRYAHFSYGSRNRLCGSYFTVCHAARGLVRRASQPILSVRHRCANRVFVGHRRAEALQRRGINWRAAARRGTRAVIASIPTGVDELGQTERVDVSRDRRTKIKPQVFAKHRSDMAGLESKAWYPAAKAEIPKLVGVKHVFVKAAARLNNRAENSHQPTRERERRMRGFRDPKRTQKFRSCFGPIRQHFALTRHVISTSLYRKQLAARFVAWREFTELAQNPSTAF
jgi:hypothetical protein